MRITGDWLTHPGTQGVFAALTGAGFQALLVGGCVRNALMGVGVADLDLATDARPEVVTALAEAAGFRVIPTGIAHGTVTVIAAGIPHQVTTFRRDVETDGRHAVVAFSTEVAGDAARRDFTMNALYADAQGRVIDPLGGLPDLLARHVRFVGDPAARIGEDYLRILRFFRFHALYGDPAMGLDPEGLAACAALNSGIETLSRERIGAEMRKLLDAPDPAPAVASMASAGVLARVLPGADPAALPVLVHLEELHDVPADWLRRLAVLGQQDPTDALRLSRDETAILRAVRDGALGDLGLAALGFRLRHLAEDAALVRAALTGAPLPENWRDDLARGKRHVTAPVLAADLLPVYQGAALGVRLRALEDRWLRSDLRASRDELLG